MSTTSKYPLAPFLLAADEPPPSSSVLSSASSETSEPSSPKRHHCWKHGHHRSPTYRSWEAMIRRCRNPADDSYDSYGGRGIKVCDRWLGKDGFSNFLADVGEKPTPKHTLDRRDNDADYAPANCRWATATEQARNRPDNRRFAVGGLSLTAAEWSERTGIAANTIYCRIVRGGWTPEEAVTVPTGGKRTAAKTPEPLPCKRGATASSS